MDYNEGVLRENLSRILVDVEPIHDLNEMKISSTKVYRGTLPKYYLVYFLFVDFLNFTKFGPFEKIAYIIPFKYKGNFFRIEYRKFGMVLVGEEAANFEPVKNVIIGAVRASEKYYSKMAEDSLSGCNLNVVNSSAKLWQKFEFFKRSYFELNKDSENKKIELDQRQKNPKDIKSPADWINDNALATTELRKRLNENLEPKRLLEQANWMAHAAVDAFFSWTEHFFTHLLVLKGVIKTGEDFKVSLQENWTTKAKKIFSMSDPDDQKIYSEFQKYRDQQRNFYAHGALGKQGEALRFHSSCGAVPIKLLPSQSIPRFTVWGRDENKPVSVQTLERTDAFVEQLFSGWRSIAEIYLREYGLDSILQYSSDGTYEKVMNSPELMKEFCEALSYEIDRYENMDF